MRVITGTARGHRLKAPPHLKLRPTPARVKEALFSSLGDRIANARVLELFAGTGAFGIECLSRGSANVLFVEKDRRAISLIGENLQKTRLADRAEVWRADVRQALEYLQRDKKEFDLIFADPPYSKGEAGGGAWNPFLLGSEALSRALAHGGLFLLEHFKKNTDLPSSLFSMKRQFVFGDTVVSMFESATVR